MKLVYIDPNCSGIQVRELASDSEKAILAALSAGGVYSENCADLVYYAVVTDSGEIRLGEEDFT